MTRVNDRRSDPASDALVQELLIGGAWVPGDDWSELANCYTRAPLATVATASEEQIDEAVAAARSAFEREPLPPYRRYEILSEAARRVEEARDELIGTIVAESGFTTLDARGEVNRCVQTLTLSAEEAKRITGEMVPIEAAPGQRRRMGYTIRVPVGVVCAITPFNSPLNTVTHKVAPALAAGNTVVLKPSSYTPLTAGVLCRCLVEAGLPAGHINLVLGSGRRVGAALARHPDIAFYTFTGSTEVGRELKRDAGLRPASLELGSISATLVCADADLDRAVAKCVRAAFRKAGQVCTSIQRLYVHADVHDDFVERFAKATAALVVGDPSDPETEVGPMITPAEADRVEAWIAEAVEGGASVLLGGRRQRSIVIPTILADAPATANVVCREVFGPVVVTHPYTALEQAFAEMNDTPYGLAAGVFTSDVATAMEAVRALHVGGVHINETSSSRVDLMPYGGAKDSGLGREGPRYAIEEMTEERLVTVSW